MPARRHRVSAGLAGVLAAAALAGCGSGPAATTTTVAPDAAPAGPQGGAAPSLSDEQRAQFTRLRECLRKQGVDLPEGGPGGGAPPQLDPDALQACSQYLPQGVAPPGEAS